jgi:hypothetical protein
VTHIQELDLTRKIAEALGNGWTAQPGHHSDDTYLSGPDGESIHLLFSGYGNHRRIQIAGSAEPEMYEHIPYNTHMPKITVSEDKPAIRIAGDIERRLLPLYRPLLVELFERKRSRDTFQRESNMLAQLLLGALGDGCTLRARSHQGSDAPHIYINGAASDRAIHGDVEVRGPDSVKFEITVAAGAAVALAGSIAHIRKPA